MRRAFLSIVLGGAACLAVAIAAPAAHADGMHWSGDVDDTAMIAIHADDVRIASNMKGVRDERHQFRGELPERFTRVRLLHQEGRGEIRVVQQPSRFNDYTAVVRIEDHDPGRSHYEFTLGWGDNDDSYRDRDRDDRRNDDDRRDRDRDRNRNRDRNRDGDDD